MSKDVCLFSDSCNRKFDKPEPPATRYVKRTVDIQLPTAGGGRRYITGHKNPGIGAWRYITDHKNPGIGAWRYITSHKNSKVNVC